MAALFVDHAGVATLVEQLEVARVAVRRAKRYTTKAESPTGQDAHRALHEAETVLDAALKKLEG
jgi:hypothetical protein